jgi:isoleucyl-tRNA synthetase
VLERARAAGQIGQSLEADIVLTGNVALDQILGGMDIDLAKVFIVSHVDVRSGQPEGEMVELEGVGAVGISMARARGQKCARCWNYREEVASEEGLCSRCEKIVADYDSGLSFASVR